MKQGMKGNKSDVFSQVMLKKRIDPRTRTPTKRNFHLQSSLGGSGNWRESEEIIKTYLL